MADYPLLDVVGTMLAFLILVNWTWILVDVIDRQDLSGWAKAAWILVAIVLPILGLLAYIVSRGNQLAERRVRSPACFAALLGGADNGRWPLAPAGAVVATSRRYRPGTLVLETDFETPHGVRNRHEDDRDSAHAPGSAARGGIADCRAGHAQTPRERAIEERCAA